MPELPEVESAARRLRAAACGKRIVRVVVRHPSVARRLPPGRARSLRGARIVAVDRRGKHQLLRLDDGRTLHAHFRMTGDWDIAVRGAPLPRFARAVLDLDDGTRVVLDDPRALSTLDIHPAGAEPVPRLGLEPDDPALTAAWLATAVSARRGPIKPVLLDQRVIAGLGNIYAAETLWRARIAPTRSANGLTPAERARLIAAMRRVLADASGARYGDGETRFAVYDRAGEPCRRCGAALARIVQAGRSTYFCPVCQR